MQERLQKVLASAGFGSRREIETWITEGRIKINGQVAKLGDKVGEQDKITLNGKLIRRHQKPFQRKVIAYHKPEGEVCSRRDPEGRPTIYQNLPRMSGMRWVSVGRLDINTSGLILLTNDGELANRLMHPSYAIEREYAVRVLGEVPADTIEQLKTGVMLDDGQASFDTVVDAGGQGINRWYHVTLKEGRNREVRRLWESVGFMVSRLIRVRYANVELGRRLPKGKWRYLMPAELDKLLSAVGIENTPDHESNPRQRTQTRKKKSSPYKKRF